MRFRNLLAAIGLLLTAASANAQMPSDPIPGTWSDEGTGLVAPQSTDTVGKAVRDGFDAVSGYILKSADMVPPDKYGYQPTKEVRTLGQLLGHIVDGYAYFCTVAAGKKVEWSDTTEKGATDKTTMTQKLKQATGACQATYSGKGQLSELIKNNEHTNLHYGNLITYLRMLGLKPPSS
jgi:uncharacterized damage-inducible protein DinB